jgi:hypothetical protein
MTGPGEAYYDKRHNAWHVEIFYGDGFQEFKIGELEINGCTQNIIAPSKNELLRRFQEHMFQGLTVLVEIETPNERTHQLIKELAAGGTVQRV